MNTRKGWIIWLLPLALFAGLLFLMGGNLGKPQQQIVRSRMIDKAPEAFALPGFGEDAGLSNTDLATGKPVLVNLFASWCLPCAVEAPQLEALKAKGVTIHGIAIRDTQADVGKFLARHGNPYSLIGDDARGRMMLAFGASGVPETYVLDGKGVIRFQHLGEIRPEHVDVLLAELEKAR